MSTYFVRRYKNRMMTAVYAYQSPHTETQPTIWIQTQGDMPRRIKFACQLQWCTQRWQWLVRYYYTGQSTACGNGKVKICCWLQRRIGNRRKLSFRVVVDVENDRPSFGIDGCRRLSRLEEFYHTLYGEYYDRLWDVDNHSNGGQCCN